MGKELNIARETSPHVPEGLWKSFRLAPCLPWRHPLLIPHLPDVEIEGQRQ